MMNRKKYGKKSFSLLVTLTGCALLLACVTPVHAAEITKQLSAKGYEISRRNIKELRVVVENVQDAKNILGSLSFSSQTPFFSSGDFFLNSNSSSYKEVFHKFVKRQHY